MSQFSACGSITPHQRLQNSVCSSAGYFSLRIWGAINYLIVNCCNIVFCSHFVHCESRARRVTISCDCAQQPTRMMRIWQHVTVCDYTLSQHTTCEMRTGLSAGHYMHKPDRCFEGRKSFARIFIQTLFGQFTSAKQNLLPYVLRVVAAQSTNRLAQSFLIFDF